MTIAAQALVLDFGGVVTKTLFETHPLTEKALGLRPGTLVWRGPFAPETDPLWQSMQQGDISEREYWLTRTREVGCLVGEDWKEIETFVRRVRGSKPDAVVRPEADRAIRLVARAGRRLAILSNELDLFYGANFRRQLPLLNLFEVIVDGTYTEILKPDPRAYQALLDVLALKPEACVFLDDQSRNVLGAAAAGFRAIRFDVTNPRQSFADALHQFDLDFHSAIE